MTAPCAICRRRLGPDPFGTQYHPGCVQRLLKATRQHSKN